jgi:uncharacterized membrane protein YjfL (UPF0719 family)
MAGEGKPMQWIAIIAGIVELFLAFALAVAVTWVSFKAFSRMTRDIDEMEELKKNNVSAGVLFASMLLAVAVVVREAIYPSISGLRTALFQGLSWAGVGKVLLLGFLYATLATLGAVGAVSLTTKIFLRLTREIDELKAISQNNLAVAVALGAVIVTMGLFLAQGMQSLLSALVPYPAIETIKIFGK